MAKHPTHFELSPSLLDASDDRAVAVLAAYYHPLSGGGGGYTGGQFDAFDPSGHSIGFREPLYRRRPGGRHGALGRGARACGDGDAGVAAPTFRGALGDRKSTRLNSSHLG